MVPVKEPAGTGFKIFTVLTILLFLALVAGLITTYDTDSEAVAAGAPPTAAVAPPAGPSAEVAAQAPVGAVATGGGGMAGEGAGMAVPIVVVLVVLTMMATAGIVLRRQGSVTPV